MTDAILGERFGAARNNRPDVFVFAGCFVGGVMLYFGLRYIGASQAVMTIAMVGLMCGYALAVSMVPRVRVRLDQAGDNAYYLGLLFTLTSMAVALYEFRVSQIDTPGTVLGAEQIIRNFGVALATTIAGIALRVVLNQMRVDPADVEAMTRIELAEAAKRVKAAMDSVALHWGLTLQETQQRSKDQIEGLTKEVTNTLGTFSRHITDSAEELSKKAGAAHAEAIKHTAEATRSLALVTTEAEAAAVRLRGIEAPPEELRSRLGAMIASLERGTAEVNAVVQRMKEAGTASRDVGQELRSAADRLAQVCGVIATEQAASVSRVAATAMRLEENLAAAAESIKLGSSRLAEYETQAVRATKAAADSEAAAGQVVQNLAEATRSLTKFIQQQG